MTTQEYEDGLIELVEEIVADALDLRSTPLSAGDRIRTYIRENRPTTTLISGSYDDLVKAAGTTEEKVPYDEEN